MAYSSLSDPRVVCAENLNQTFWMGLDVHEKSYSIAVVNGSDQVFTWSAPANPDNVVQHITELGITIAGSCFEAGPTGYRRKR